MAAVQIGHRSRRLAVPVSSTIFIIIVAHDLLAAFLSVYVAIVINGDVQFLSDYSNHYFYSAVIFAGIFGTISINSNIYRSVWRFASVGDLIRIVCLATAAVLIFYSILFLINRMVEVPRSVPVIQWFLLITMLAGPRFCRRLWLSRRHRHGTVLAQDQTLPVLLIGTGEGSRLFIEAMQRDPKALYRVVGMLGFGRRDVGRLILGARVLGAVGDLDQVVWRLGREGQHPRRLIVTEPAGGAVLRPLVGEAERLGLVTSRLPDLTEFKAAIDDGRVELRTIALTELLGRPQAKLDHSAIDRLIEGRRVLVTGAGGSIGSELTRQVAARQPALILLLDNSEFNLYTIDMELHVHFPGVPRVTLLCDVRNRTRVEHIFAQHRPDLVFHAAALKHVPMVELNPAEGALTNAIGTRNVADAALRQHALAMVQISTDKAVNPTSTMGASKRLAELYTQALDLEGAPAAGAKRDEHTRFMTVRFGNVLGSSGSVVPLFRRQLESRGPLTVTHPEIKRYFMTVQEAVQLVLQASSHGVRHPDRRGEVFVLDMGEPVKIIDIARQMIRMAGLKPDVDVKIEIVGLRPGEKLYEELFDDQERRLHAGIEGVFAAICRGIGLTTMRAMLDELERACYRQDTAQVSDMVRRYLESVITLESSSAGAAQESAAHAE